MGHTSKNRVTAALLTFFLWGFGVHKFYLGRVGAGLAYLVGTWALILMWWPLLIIPSILALIDFVRLLVITDNDFARIYLGAPAPHPRANATAAPEPAFTLRSCPHCAESIQQAAVVCKHCGRDVPAWVPAAPPSDADIMRALGIERVGERYRYKTFMYDRLQDAANYARLQAR